MIVFSRVTNVNSRVQYTIDQVGVYLIKRIIFESPPSINDCHQILPFDLLLRGYGTDVRKPFDFAKSYGLNQ